MSETPRETEQATLWDAVDTAARVNPVRSAAITRARRLADAIWGRLVVEQVADLSDAELERALTSCAGGMQLVRLAQCFRDARVLVIDAEHSVQVNEAGDWSAMVSNATRARLREVPNV